MVFAPAPQLTVTVEQRGDEPDIHVHAGGQGVWQARMVRSLGIRVVFCAAFGGETGQIARHLIAGEGIEVCGVDAQSRSGAYVQDRRGGERVDIAEVVGDPLTRHELDELYGIALTEGLRARVAVLSGPPAGAHVVPPEVYRRLASDLSRNGCLVLADLSGDYLSQAVAGGLRVVKVSQDQLVADGRIDGAGVDALVGALNVTRHGLGTGRSEAVAQLKTRVQLVAIRTTRKGETRGEGADVQMTPDQLAERMRRS